MCDPYVLLHCSACRMHFGANLLQGRPVVLAGKSLGSRVSCFVSSTVKNPAIKAVVCFGYPLIVRTPSDMPTPLPHDSITSHCSQLTAITRARTVPTARTFYLA